MGATYWQQPLLFLVNLGFGLFASLVLLRFLLQIVRADFYNPLSQFIVKATAPVLNPMRRVIPGYKGWDIAALLLAWLIITVQMILVFMIMGQGVRPLAALLLAIPEVIDNLILIFIVALFVRAILSWVGQAGYNPVAALCVSLTEPLTAPIRRAISANAALDFSPMIVMVILFLLRMLIIPPLKHVVLAFLSL